MPTILKYQKVIINIMEIFYNSLPSTNNLFNWTNISNWLVWIYPKWFKNTTWPNQG